MIYLRQARISLTCFLFGHQPDDAVGQFCERCGLDPDGFHDRQTLYYMRCFGREIGWRIDYFRNKYGLYRCEGCGRPEFIGNHDNCLPF